MEAVGIGVLSVRADLEDGAKRWTGCESASTRVSWLRLKDEEWKKDVVAWRE